MSEVSRKMGIIKQGPLTPTGEGYGKAPTWPLLAP